MNGNKSEEVRFSSTQVAELAKFIYELTVLGAAYRVSDYVDGWGVAVTGF